MILYHATYKAHLESIIQNGLGFKQNKNWDISEDKVTYFTTNIHCAEAFCECAEDVSPEIYDSGIVILECDSKDINNLELDTNDKTNESFTTTDIICFEKLKVILV